MEQEATFYRRAEEWLEQVLERNPVAATSLGDHRWDDRLADSSLEALEEQDHLIRTALAEFEAMDTSSFRLDARIDHELILRILGSFAREYTRVEGHLRNPGGYLDELFGGTFMLVVRDFAPLSQRLRSVLGRLREVPRVLQEGRTNLVPERVPPVWAQIALEQIQQAPGLFLGLLPALAAQDSPDLHAELTQAGQVAVQALQEYAAFLKEEVLPGAAGDFAAGRQLFDEMLREEHMVDYDADQLLEIGWEQFHRTRSQMQALVREIDPQRTVEEVLESVKADHPSAEGLLDAYREAMAATRQFVIDHEIATIPPGEKLRIVETPPYLRPIIPYAAYNMPGILEEQQEGIFWVTPVDPHAPPEQQQQQLRAHHWGKLPVAALHEGYPGHHLQLIWANRQETIPRRMGSFLATLFIEGWAFYCEELMEQLGYIAQPIQRLGRLSDQLWRAARIVLDVSLHTRGMTVDEAVQFLIDECRLEPVNALAEVRRYTHSPTQPQSYLMGKLQILDLVADYRQLHPEASMRQLHDGILGCGSLPPRLMRRRLLGDG